MVCYDFKMSSPQSSPRTQRISYLYYALADFASACSAISSVAGGELVSKQK
jgi:hypothetical protein